MVFSKREGGRYEHMEKFSLHHFWLKQIHKRLNLLLLYYNPHLFNVKAFFMLLLHKSFPCFFSKWILEMKDFKFSFHRRCSFSLSWYDIPLTKLCYSRKGGKKERENFLHFTWEEVGQEWKVGEKKSWYLFHHVALAQFLAECK